MIARSLRARPLRSRGLGARSVVALALVTVSIAALTLEGTAQSRRTTRGGRRLVPPATARLADSVLAIVGTHAITRSELDQRLEEMPPQVRSSYMDAEGRKNLLERLVEEHVWLASAERAGVPERPEVKRQIEANRRRIVLSAHVQEVMGEVPAPTDSAVRAYYEAHKGDPAFQAAESRKVRHIQVESEKDARDVRQRLARGEDFAKLARERSKDPITKDAGGVVERVDRGGMFGALGRHPALAESAFAATPGRLVGPVKSDRGWHVIRVEEITPAGPQPLERVRAGILQTLGRESQEGYYRAQLERAKERVGFRWNQSAVDSALYGRQSAADLFRTAQLALTADDRIAAYERVVQEYPRSDQAPQALFMVGFIYSEEKKDYDRAEAAFRRILAEYPTSELAHSAQWMLDNMRSDAVPNFDLPGGVQRSESAPDTTGAPGTKPR